jgi:hypothetical protein
MRRRNNANNGGLYIVPGTQKGSAQLISDQTVNNNVALLSSKVSLTVQR